ncbi:MAG: hypothetical protein AAFZ17_01670 [Cyanobacteria bacterium J06650_10]
MNLEESLDFQNTQQEVVSKIGSLISVLQSHITELASLSSDSSELEVIRRLQPVIGEFSARKGELYSFYNNYHYDAYYQVILNILHHIGRLLAVQTMPTSNQTLDSFVSELKSALKRIQEVMIATAQIVTPQVESNIKAKNPFTAYLFLSRLIDTSSKELCLIDPYVDASIFYRYLYRLQKSVKISLISNRKNLTGTRKEQFQTVEEIFKAEYSLYTSDFRNSLHDRYLINETAAYVLGGSLKDAARKSDYSVTQVSEKKRKELLKEYGT